MSDASTTITTTSSNSNGNGRLTLAERGARLLLPLLPLILTIFSVVWWAQSVERRIALLEKDAASAHDAALSLQHSQETLTSRRDEQFSRLEDRVNRHEADDLSYQRTLAPRPK